VWFVASLIAHTGSDHAAFIIWLRAPVPGILMIVLLMALFHHTALGLQVVIEDYIHSGAKLAMLVIMRFSCIGLAVAGIIATMRITLIH
jgi:succinate dehydrogenase / fumarate reductase membrane anchor subunit